MARLLVSGSRHIVNPEAVSTILDTVVELMGFPLDTVGYFDTLWGVSLAAGEWVQARGHPERVFYSVTEAVKWVAADPESALVYIYDDPSDTGVMDEARRRGVAVLEYFVDREATSPPEAAPDPNVEAALVREIQAHLDAEILREQDYWAATKKTAAVDTLFEQAFAKWGAVRPEDAFNRFAKNPLDGWEFK